MVSSEAITALKPITLQGTPHYDNHELTWTTDEGVTTTINTQEVVAVTEIPGKIYLIVTLTETQPSSDQGSQQQQQPPPSPPPPFTLSSFLAPSLPSEVQDHVLHNLPSLLHVGPEASLDVLVSERSGTGLAPQFYQAVLQPLLLGILGLTPRDGGGDGEDTTSYSVTFTKSADTIKDFARERWSHAGSPHQKRETVLLLSGDGGIVDLLSATTTTTTTPPPPPPPSPPTQQGDATSPLLPTVILFPLGTGNALFHSLHKPHYKQQPLPSPSPSPSPLVLALRALLRGRPAPLPTFQATFAPAAHPVSGAETSAITTMTGAIVASYGFHAQLVWESDTPAYRVHGAKRFGMVAQALLGESHAYHAVVETQSVGHASSRRVMGHKAKEDGDDDNDRTHFNYVLTTLCSNLEKTFTISPASEPLDGVLRLVHFGGADGKRTMEIMGAAYNQGSHVGMEGVGYDAVESVKVTTLEEDARWRKVCIDGTILELPKEGSMTISKSPRERLQVVVLDA